MATYSIRDIENLSGIKAHTLRIWEQRYKILTPKRTDTNIRYYTDNDLKQILNIALLSKKGFRIGRIAKMSDQEMVKNINQLSDTELKYELHVNDLTQSMIDVDEPRFEKIMSTCILKYGLEQTMLSVVYPFLEKIGVMWITGAINPAQEHFITNLIRQKLIVAIDGQMLNFDKSSRHYLLFLPEGELHELSLLFLTYLLKARNNKVTYLGTSVPLADVAEVGKFTNPDYVYTIFTSSPPEDMMEQYIDDISTYFQDIVVLVSGLRMLSYEGNLPSNVVILENMEAVLKFVDKVAQEKAAD